MRTPGLTHPGVFVLPGSRVLTGTCASRRSLRKTLRDERSIVGVSVLETVDFAAPSLRMKQPVNTAANSGATRFASRLPEIGDPVIAFNGWGRHLIRHVSSQP